MPRTGIQCARLSEYRTSAPRYRQRRFPAREATAGGRPREPSQFFHHAEALGRHKRKAGAVAADVADVEDVHRNALQFGKDEAQVTGTLRYRSLRERFKRFAVGE